MSLSRGKLKLLFLYSELADYFLACVRKLASTYEVEIHIMHWTINKEAPFAFDFPEGISFYNKAEYNKQSLREKVKSIAPDFIYCSGWMDKDYLSVVQGYKKTIPVVIGLDTKWNGSIRQRVACALGPFTLHNIFSHCWVPGLKQQQYALKLGFKQNMILTGYYTADTDFFKTLGEKIRPIKQKQCPHRLIYAGRYYEFKGIKDLWQAFNEWQEENQNDWELWCLGVGDIEPVIHPKIKHFGFVQPKDLEPYMAQSSIFVMPSHFEPWGVVLHEFAAAGFPLICSDEVGSAEAFVRQGDNGYIYHSGNVNELKQCISRMTSLTDTEIIKMGEKSVSLALSITPEKWGKTLMGLFNNK